MSKATDLMDEINQTLKEPLLKMGSDPSLKVTYQPTNILPIDILLQGGIPRGRFITLTGDYCLAPQTMILCADLHWRRLDELHVGDEIIGFDEEPQGKKRRRYRRAIVTSLGDANLPTYEIVNDQGETTYASEGHLWLVSHRSQHGHEWRRTEDLRADDKIVWFGSPWEYDESRDAGWLSGVFDGEGWVSNGRVGFGQNDGIVMDEVRRQIEERGYEHYMSENGGGVKQFRIAGGIPESLRFLGSIRPHRLIDKASKLWEGASIWSKISKTTRVVSVKPVGIRGVITIGTSTKTLIADGMLSHNSTLKSYIGLKAIASTQQAGGTAAIIDTEHSFDPEWADALGVDLKSLILMHPDTGELAIDAAETLIRGGVDLIVFDSVAATLPQAERGKRLHDENVQPARIAQLMSVAMRKLTAANDKTAIVWINQLRMNIGVTFGNPEVATGGKALPYYSSYILSIRKVGKITRDVQTWDGEKFVNTKEQVGQKFKATVEKSKLSKPFRDVYFTWDYQTAEIDEASFLISLGLEAGLITQKGAAWTFDGESFRGREKFHDQVRDDPELNARIRKAVLPSNSRGSQEADKSEAAAPRRRRSSAKAQEPTPTAAQARSSSTAATKTRSSRSKTP